MSIYDDPYYEEPEGPMQRFECTNPHCECVYYYVPLIREVTGAAPPYGPPNGLHVYWVPDEDKLECDECGLTGKEH